MAEESAGEKTERATPKRREDARRKGDVAQSREINAVVAMAALVIAAGGAFGTELVATVMASARAAWSGTHIVPGLMADYHAVLLHHGIAIGVAMLPLMLVLLLVSAAGSLVQVGPMFSVEALAFRGDRINPLAGLKRLLSVDKLFDLAKALVKVAVAGAAAWMVLGGALEGILALVRANVMDGMDLAGALVLRVVILFLVGLLAFSIFDLAWVRHRFEKKLKMTRQEVRDEHKQREGDPQVRAQIRARQRDMSRLRMIAEVAEADVVITNPTHFAVAIRYERDAMAAPRVVAKGRNKLATRIREEARRHGVPIVENPPVAQLLYKTVAVGKEVPETLYRAVAEVLAYVTRLDPRRARAWQAAP